MKKPLSKAIKTFYGFGDMGFGLMTSVELYMFVFFLTNVAKFSLPMVALIGSITSIADAALSPFYGAFISGTKPLKWGRNRSWMLIMPPIVVVLYMFQFTRIGSDAVAAAIVCAGFILSHIAWNIPWVANMSLIPTLANNPEERALLASRRATWSAMAGVLFSYIGSPLAAFLGKATGNQALGYTLLAGIMASVMLIGYWTVFKLTAGYEETGDQSVSTAAGPPKADKVPVSIMLQTLFQNPPLIILLLGDFFRYMSAFIASAAGAYYFTYVAKNMGLFSLYLLLGSLAGVVSSYVAGLLRNKLSPRTAMLSSIFASALLMITCKFFAMNVTIFFLFAIASRLVGGIGGVYGITMYSDTAVYGEYKTGVNASPFVMGMMNLSLKTAIISRGTVIPIVLAAAGFVAGADPANASLALQNAVINVFVFIPALMNLTCGIIWLLFYKLTKEKVAFYQAEIDKRKAAAANA